jgi:hypothetical protein
LQEFGPGRTTDGTNPTHTRDRLLALGDLLHLGARAFNRGRFLARKAEVRAYKEMSRAKHRDGGWGSTDTCDRQGGGCRGRQRDGRVASEQ